jgi:hypothetical protein
MGLEEGIDRKLTDIFRREKKTDFVVVDGHQVPKAIYDKLTSSEGQKIKERQIDKVALAKGLHKLRTRIEHEIEFFEKEFGEKYIDSLSMKRDVIVDDSYKRKVSKPVHVEVKLNG